MATPQAPEDAPDLSAMRRWRNRRGKGRGGSDSPHLTPHSCHCPKPNAAASVSSPVTLDPRAVLPSRKLPQVLVMIFLFARGGCPFRSGWVGVLPPKPHKTWRISLGEGAYPRKTRPGMATLVSPGWAATSEWEKRGGVKTSPLHLTSTLGVKCSLGNKPGIKLYFRG